MVKDLSKIVINYIKHVYYQYVRYDHLQFINGFARLIA